MHLEEFADGQTFLHHMDPRVKFISGVPFLIVVALMKGIAGPLAALMVAASIATMARLDIHKLMARMLGVNVFVAFLWLTVPFTLPGSEAFSLGPFAASREGIAMALSLTLKTNAIVLATIAIFGTTEAFSLAHALVHLHAPQKLVYLFFFFYRYISVLHEEYTRLREAMRARAFRARTDMHTYRSLAWLVGMLLIRSHDRSERIYEAMLCRGFHGHFPIIRHFHLHRIDVAFGAAMLAVSAALGAMQLSWS